MKRNPSSFSEHLLFLAVLCLALRVCASRGATISWTNTSGGVWGNPANWSPNTVPGLSDTALITSSGNYTVTVDTDVSVANLTLGGASGSQTLTNYFQTVTFANSSSVTVNGILSQGGGTLNGGPLAIQGTMNWYGGSVTLPVTVAASGVINFGGTGGIIEGPLTNSGTINWSGASASLAVYNNNAAYKGTIYNQAGGLFNVQTDQSLYCGCYGFESFVNAGTVRKTAGAGATTFSLSFTNSGTVDAQSGTIRFSAGGNVSGTYNTATGAVIEFTAGNFAESGAVTVSGSGICRLSGATVTLNDRITKFILASGNVQLSPTFQGTGTIQSLQIDGAYLLGTNLVTGTLGMNGGGLAAGAPLTVAAGGVLNFNGAAVTLYSPLTNSGTVNWSGGTLSVNNNNAAYTGAIYNQATGLFNLQGDLGLSCGCYGFEIFRNAGTVRKSAGLGLSTFSLPFTNLGLVDAQTGTLRFSSGGNIGANYNTASGAVIEFAAGTFAHNGVVNITGSGICRQNGATVTLFDRIANFQLFSGNVGLTPTFQTNGTIKNLQLDGATLMGTNVVTGTLGVNGGGLAVSSPLTVAPSGVLNFNGAAVSLYSPITNSGTINWSGSGLSLNNNNAAYTGIIRNQSGALFNLQSDQGISCGCYGFETFINYGTVRKTAGLGQSSFSIPFINLGLVDAQSGSIRFAGSGNIGGTYNMASGAVIEFTGGNFSESGTVSITGAGICRQNGANVTLNDRINNFLLVSGNVMLTPTFQTNGTIQNLQLDGAVLVGASTVTGTLGMNGGSLASALTILPGGTINFNGAGVNLYAPLTNWGTINWSGASLYVANNNAAYAGIVVNQPYAVFNIQSDQSLTTAAYGYEAMYNAGILRKTSGLGTTTINVPFTDTGTLDAQSGVIRFSGPYTQSGGLMNFGITSLAYYGQISFAANAPFTGTLTVNFNGGYRPSIGDSFGLVGYASSSGIFTNSAIQPCALWQTNYGATTFSITASGLNAVAGCVTLAPVASVALNVGQYMVITNTATDTRPGSQISYSLPTAPSGASLGPTTGVLQWRAPASRAGTIIPFVVVATDNGSPPASDTKGFNVYVNPIPPPTLTPLYFATGHFAMQINGTVGPDYAILASSNLVSWIGLSTSTPAALPYIFTDNNAGAVQHRFYRVLAQ
jgi:hypothetical protein